MAEKREEILKLKTKPKGVKVLEGFPGLGVVSTIATSFLIEHLKCEKIGSFYFEDKEVAPVVSIHKCELISPVGIYYSKKANLVIIHAITSPLYVEWEAADFVLDLCRQLSAKELITLEGIGAPPTATKQEPTAFFFSPDKGTEKRMKEVGVGCLGEGSVIGVTAALLSKNKEFPMTCFFADTFSNLPDARAAAKVIEVLDKYLRLNVDYKPLIKQAEEFEERIKQILQKTAQTQEVKERKDLSYLG